MYLLSICVPSYNTANFIDKCLPSYVDERIFDLVEIFLVNDGSTDGITLAKLRTYETKYPKLFKVIDKKNGGHGSCINVTIPLATGKYYKVIDGDDYVDPNSFVDFILKLKSIDTDIVTHCYNNVYHNGRITKEDCVRTRFEFEVAQPLEKVVLNYKIFSLATLSFKTSLLKMISLQVLEKTFYEDAEYSLYPFAKAQTITHLNLYLYQYYQGSSDAQSTNIISLRNRINELIKVFFNLVSFYENHCQIVPPHISTHMYDVCCASFKVILRVFLKFTNRDHKRKELKNFIKQIKEHSPFFYQKIKKDRTLKMIKCLDYFGYKLCLLFTYKDALYPIFKKKIKKQK